MNSRLPRRYTLLTSLLFILLPSVIHGEDWPMFGRDATRNAVSPEKSPPLDWEVGTFDRKTGKWTDARNIKWAARLGAHTIGDPVFADGLIWVGTNNDGQSGLDVKEDVSLLMCFRERDGKLLYQFVSPRLKPTRERDHHRASFGCAPLVEGDRIWFTTNRCETVCMNIAPLKRGMGEPKIAWKVDMIEKLGVEPVATVMGPHLTCSVASYKDWIYVITGNGTKQGVDEKIAAPEAPSLVCFNKDTGDIVWTDNSPGKNILHGQWASPLAIEINRKAQVIAPQGDGWVRSFDALTGKLIWKFDMNHKTSKWILGGRGTRNNILATPVFYDGLIYLAGGQCMMHGEGAGRLCCINPTKTGDISSEQAVNSEDNPLPQRRLQAVNSDEREKAIVNPNSGMVWEYIQADQNDDGKFAFEEAFHRTMSSVAIKDDLLFAVDFAGLVHCVNAKTGKVYWTYDLFAQAWASPLIVDDKIYIGDEDGDIATFNLSADPKKAGREGVEQLEPINGENGNNLGSSIYTSPIFANGTLYIASRSHLFAIPADDKEKGERKHKPAVSQKPGFWPQWRGPNRDNVSTETGLLKEWPKDGPPLVREIVGIGEGIGSLAVAGGKVFLLGYIGDSEYVTALDEQTGHRVWASRIGPTVGENFSMRWLSQRTPTVDGERSYAFTSRGELICLATADGQELWRKSYIKDFGAKEHSWGLCDYPLVDGDRLICAPGGSEATVVALEKATGNVIWNSKFDAADDWSGMVVSEAAGVRQYVMYLGNRLCGVAAEDGKLLWENGEVAMPRNYNTPIIRGDMVLCATATGSGSGGLGLLNLHAEGNGVRAEQQYFLKRWVTPNPFTDTAVLAGDHVYLLCGGWSAPTCVKLKSGQVAWQRRDEGGERGAWVFAEGHLYLRRADGRVALVEATSTAYVEKGAFTIPQPKSARGATMPVIAGGHLYLRDDDRLLCYDVRAEASNGDRPRTQTIKLGLPNSSAANKPPDRTLRSIFVPTPHDVVTKMLELAGVKKGDVVYDLGSGDGRIVIAAAKKYEARAVGYEIDKGLVELSRENAARAKVDNLVTIYHEDLFKADLAKSDVVAVYLLPKQLETLLPQLEKLKPGSRIVSHQFEIPGVEVQQVVEVESLADHSKHKIYLWTTPLTRNKDQPAE